MEDKKVDFLAIGDIVIDAFIRLKDARVHCSVDNENCELCVRFGDKVPFESVDVINAVGNSPNAAVSASRLGLASAVSCVVGDDANGKACLDSLKKDGVDTSYVEVDPRYPTNYHYVLWYDVERTILVKHAPFDRHMPKGVAPKWIYLSSLGENTEPFHHEITAWLKEHPETKLAFQPGTFQMKLGKEKLADIYKLTEVFFCNYEEAQRILGSTEHDKKKLMDALRALGPKMVVMTDGMNGAYFTDGTKYLFMGVYPHVPMERTGAGDAFSSTFTVALGLGKSVEEALRWAPINSMSVVQQIGAQRGLLTREKLEEFLAKAPADYQPKEI
jgi:ribokinase